MPTPDRHQGARSLPYKQPFLRALFFTGLWFLSLIAFGTLAVLFLLSGDRSLGVPLIGSMLGSAVLWAIAFPARRSVRCPLCKGTPLSDNRASKHSNARRIFPLNYGMTAILSLFFTMRFRCMFCGNPFDLLKKSQSSYGRKP